MGAISSTTPIVGNLQDVMPIKVHLFQLYYPVSMISKTALVAAVWFFYGLPDINGETWEFSEQKLLALSKDNLSISTGVSNIERADGLGIFQECRKRPIMAKVSSFKTKQQLLFVSKKLKYTPFFLLEHFSLSLCNTHMSLFKLPKLRINPLNLALISF